MVNRGEGGQNLTYTAKKNLIHFTLYITRGGGGRALLPTNSTELYVENTGLNLNQLKEVY